MREQSNPNSQSKLPYNPPRLTSHGDLRTITLGGNSLAGVDGSGSSVTKNASGH